MCHPMHAGVRVRVRTHLKHRRLKKKSVYTGTERLRGLVILGKKD